MSGAGEQYAGEGPAGADVVAAPSAGPVSRALRAVDYNRGLFTLTDGALVGIHPIDSRVRLALLNSRYRKEGGRVVPNIPAAPDQGFDWTTDFQWGEKLTADVTDRIRDALSRAGLVLGTDIEEVRVQVSSQRTAGRVSWEYTYRRIVDGAEVTVQGG